MCFCETPGLVPNINAPAWLRKIPPLAAASFVFRATGFHARVTKLSVMAWFSAHGIRLNFGRVDTEPASVCVPVLSRHLVRRCRTLIICHIPPFAFKTGVKLLTKPWFLADTARTG
jgi:hypothetical protein